MSGPVLQCRWSVADVNNENQAEPLCVLATTGSRDGSSRSRKMMKMEYRFATDSDLDLLATWNHQLIRDEGHRNPMTVPELRERMKRWLSAEYEAVIFGDKSQRVAFALYKENATEVYLRQLFVRPDCKRKEIGRETMRILRARLWSPRRRLTVGVLTANVSAVAFWRSVGYQDYCLTLEIMPNQNGEHARAPDALPRALSAPHSLVRLMAVRLFADKHKSEFAPVIDKLTYDDPEPLVRQLCRAYRAGWSAARR